MPSHEVTLLSCARDVARLQTQRRKLRRQLKKVDIDLRIAKRHLRALVNETEGRRPDVAPLRVFGSAVGQVPATESELPAARKA